MRAATYLNGILFWKQLALLVQTGLPLHEAWPLAGASLSGRAAAKAQAVGGRLANGELLRDALDGADELGRAPVARLRQELSAGAPLEDALRTAAHEVHSAAISRARLNARLALPAAGIALAVAINAVFLAVLAALSAGLTGGAAPSAVRLLGQVLAPLAGVSALTAGAVLLGGLLVLAAAGYAGTLLLEWPMFRRGALARRRSAVHVLLDLAVLLEDGSQLSEALASVAEASSAPGLQARLRNAAAKLAQGVTGPEPLMELDLFPPWVVWTMTSQQSPVSLGLYLRELADEMMHEVEDETRRTGNVFAFLMWFIAVVLAGGAAVVFYFLMRFLFVLTITGAS